MALPKNGWSSESADGITSISNNSENSSFINKIGKIIHQGRSVPAPELIMSSGTWAFSGLHPFQCHLPEPLAVVRKQGRPQIGRAMRTRKLQPGQGAAMESVPGASRAVVEPDSLAQRSCRVLSNQRRFAQDLVRGTRPTMRGAVRRAAGQARLPRGGPRVLSAQFP